MSSVDWRNRFGWNWISSVRNQGGCESCWAFGMTGLYEAMVRIEQCMWCRRSEGDIRNGVGKQCWDLGNLGEAATFVQNYGIADPDCFPYTEAAAIYSSEEGKGALPLSPTSDRAGRTVRAPATTTITDVTQKKNWIDTVGPMAMMFNPPVDFDAYGGGVYIPTTNVTGGAHCLLVVGFNDDAPQPYWIVKNSWGTGWGMGGFAYIGYAGNLLEPLGFVGVRGLNPDPWTKRRARNGAMIESGNGATHNNFELFIQVGANLEHWWRENSTPALPWNRVGIVRCSDPWRNTFHDDAADCPAAVQSTFNRNYELLYRTSQSGTGNGQIRHVYHDQSAGDWLDATTFGPPDPLGIAALVQSTRGAPGDFETVILRQTGAIEHWTKHNSWPWTQPPGTWYFRSQIDLGIAYAGAALVQSRLGVTGVLEAGQGELHYTATGIDSRICHYKLPSGSNSWQLLYTFGAGITSAPCMIEGQFGAANELDVGNFELCVVAGGQIQHWWRDNHAFGGWNHSATFGANANRVIALVEGSFGFNLELVVENNDGHYQHYWRDAGGWHPGVVIL
jgi:Papain family cysteine protease